MSLLIQKTNDLINYPFQFDSIRIFAMIIASVMIGYTLQPVPKWLNKLFDTSNVFKFIIIFTTISIVFFPLSPRKLLYCIIFTITTLAIFGLSRKIDIILEKHENKNSAHANEK